MAKSCHGALIGVQDESDCEGVERVTGLVCVSKLVAEKDSSYTFQLVHSGSDGSKARRIIEWLLERGVIHRIVHIDVYRFGCFEPNPTPTLRKLATYPVKQS